MLCYVMLCYVMSCYVISPYHFDILFHVFLEFFSTHTHHFIYLYTHTNTHTHIHTHTHTHTHAHTRFALEYFTTILKVIWHDYIMSNLFCFTVIKHRAHWLTHTTPFHAHCVFTDTYTHTRIYTQCTMHCEEESTWEVSHALSSLLTFSSPSSTALHNSLLRCAALSALSPSYLSRHSPFFYSTLFSSFLNGTNVALTFF